VHRTLTEDGVLWLIVGDTTIRKNWLLMPARLALSLQQVGWTIRSEVIWDKGTGRPQESPHLSDRSKNVGEEWLVPQHLGEALHQRAQPIITHCGQ